jgi:hypothetical protein
LAEIYRRKTATFATSSEVCRPKVFFFCAHDKMRSHSAASTFQAIRQLTVELLPLLATQFRPSPLDYHVFGLLNEAFVDEDVSVMRN